MSRPAILLLSLALLSMFLSCRQKPQEFREVVSMHPNGQVELARVFQISEGDSVLVRETMYWNNGKPRLEGDFDKEGQKHGLWRAWYENGNPWSEGNFRQGKADGDYRVWHENGKVYYEGRMKDDNRVGTWRFYSQEGEMLKEISY